MWDKRELLMRTLKLIDITTLSVIYTAIAIIFSVVLDKIIGPFDENYTKNKWTITLIFEICLNIGIISIAAYIIRNLVELIPFPFEGVGAIGDFKGFEHKKVKELGGGVIYGFLLFFYQNNLKSKINHVIKRFTG